MKRNAARRHTSILGLARLSDQDNDGHAPTQLRLPHTYGTHDTHEMKTRTKRIRSPGYGRRTAHTI